MNTKDVQKQIVDKIKDVDNFLVTVSANPTVDELSAALGITLVLNDMGKHATAVFSGDIPPAITFLDPQKTFENTVDSLRDFIIALDKEKADHLRYKVDGDMVKIFITPYKTTITDKDLDFSQGDYNVEMVLAIGVKSEGDLDRALADHGRILHDATVVSLSLDAGSSDIGTINWQDTNASSYSEMLVGLIDQIKSGKNPFNEQVATAFLTGIVAATERFSNTHTTSETMTVAAQLMAAGANQQLIATKLEEAEELSDNRPSSDEHDKKDISEDVSEKIDKQDEPVKDRQTADGTMSISHEPKGDIDEVSEQVFEEQQKEATEAAEEQLAEGLDKASIGGAAKQQTTTSLQDDLRAAADRMASNDAILPAPVAVPAPEGSEPTLGGTLNATTEQAAAEKLVALNNEQNKTILSHESGGYVEGGQPSLGSPVNSFASDEDRDDVPMASPQAAHEPEALGATSGADYSQHGMTITPPQSHEPTLAELDAQNHAHGVAAMPPMPDFSTLPQLPAVDSGFIEAPLPAPQMNVGATPAATAPQSFPSPVPFTPPAADSMMGPLPSLSAPAPTTTAAQEQSLSDRLSDILPPAQPGVTPPPLPNDPAQFQIPGQ